MLRKFIFLVALFISAGQLWAANGTIRLTIFDQETGEALIGATAVIKGTTQGGVADLDGKATINNVTAGSYAIEVAYVSYQTKVIENVNVGEGETVVMEVGLSTETVGLEEIVVTADAIKSSDAALLTLQKKSPGLFDAVSSENFTKLGDSDAGAAVKRVVGVTVEGGKYVYVRGLGDRYSKSSLNSATIPSADPNKNAVQLDMFPSNLIDNIIVYKTFTPDLPGDFSGGYVDITTKDFPDRFTVQVQASAGYNTQATFNEDFMTYPGGSKDWLGKDDGTRALPDILAGLTQQEFNNAVLNNDAAKDLFTKSFNNHNFDFTRSSQPVNHSFSLSVGNQFNVFNKQLGFVAGLTYDRDFNYYEDGEIGRWLNTSGTVPTLDGDKNRQLTEQKSTENVSIGALLNTTLKLNNNNKVAVNLLYNQNGDKMTSWQYGPYGGDASINFDQNPQLYWDSRSLFFEERAIKNGMLRGEHVIPSLNNFKIKWFTSNTNSTLDQPDFRLIVSTNQVNEESGEILSQRINTARFRPGRYFRSMDEFITDNHLDFELPVTVFSSKESKIKFGGAYLSKDREFRERRYEYLDGNANNVFEGSVNNLFSPDILGLTPDGLGEIFQILASR